MAVISPYYTGKLYLCSNWSQIRAIVAMVTTDAITVPERYLALETLLQPIAIDIPSILTEKLMSTIFSFMHL